MQEAPSAPSPFEFVQYGVPGLVVVALIMGWIWAKPAVDRLLKDKDRIIEERNGQLEKLTTEIRELRAEVSHLRRDLGHERNRNRDRDDK